MFHINQRVMVKPDLDVSIAQHVYPGFTNEMRWSLGETGRISFIYGDVAHISFDHGPETYHFGYNTVWLLPVANEVTIVEEDNA